MVSHKLRRGFETLLEIITALIVASLTALIVMGTIYRYMGSALSWYDEVASIGLVWMTYFGSRAGGAEGRAYRLSGAGERHAAALAGAGHHLCRGLRVLFLRASGLCRLAGAGHT
jgi:hypothetical protein